MKFYFDENFTGVLRVFYGCFKEVSRRFQWCLEEVSRAFQRSYMNVRQLHSRLKGILRDFKGL